MRSISSLAVAISDSNCFHSSQRVEQVTHARGQVFLGVFQDARHLVAQVRRVGQQFLRENFFLAMTLPRLSTVVGDRRWSVLTGLAY